MTPHPGTAEAFRALHHGRAANDPLVLPGPWDAASAQVFAEAGFVALATPSAGVAASLGYADGATPAAEMFAAVGRIVRAVGGRGVAGRGVAVSADLEDGYGLPPRELVERTLESGAVGINLEDSTDGVLRAPGRHAEWLAQVREAAGDALFVNARVDTYVRATDEQRARGAAELVDETVARALRYLDAGADGIYPIAAPPSALPHLAAAIPAPLNAHVHPDVSPSRLGELGAARVTFGPTLQRRALGAVRALARELSTVPRGRDPAEHDPGTAPHDPGTAPHDPGTAPHDPGITPHAPATAPGHRDSG